jgi:hypothetical protein
MNIPYIQVVSIERIQQSEEGNVTLALLNTTLLDKDKN